MFVSLHQILKHNTMAKGTMVMGKARGKVGGVVFRVVDGKQIMSELNNKPYNPKSFGQERQRVRFAFVQSLVSQVPKEALVGLGGRASSNRAELSKAVFGGTSVTGATMGELSLTMDLHSVVLSRGSVQAPSRTITLTWSERSEGILLHSVKSANVSEPRYDAERMMVVVAPSLADQGTKPIVNYYESGSEFDALIPLPKLWWDSDLAVTVFVWAATRVEGATSANLTSVRGNGAAELIGGASQGSTEMLEWSPSVVAYEGIFNADANASMRSSKINAKTKRKDERNDG